MSNIIKRKNIYFLISLLVIIPGLVSLILYGLQLSIDFTGGSRMVLLFPQTVNSRTVNDVRQTFADRKIQIATLQPSGNSVILRTTPINEKQNRELRTTLTERVGAFQQESFETIGPTIGQETTTNALKAILVASFLIVLYIAWSFRKVPKPTSSWRFGITAVITLLHDILVLLGLFSLFGHFFHVEIDSLFITALLTVMGFSVHDTIVVFDRIRENLLRGSSFDFPRIVNDSILQTLNRSLITSLTALFVLLSMMLFGGENTRWFIIALIIGIISGTFSSIFNAAPLLVLWDELDRKRKKKE
jgi:preprotein translocase subunit SecF